MSRAFSATQQAATAETEYDAEFTFKLGLSIEKHKPILHPSPRWPKSFKKHYVHNVDYEDLVRIQGWRRHCMREHDVSFPCLLEGCGSGKQLHPAIRKMKTCQTTAAGTLQETRFFTSQSTERALRNRLANLETQVQQLCVASWPGRPGSVDLGPCKQLPVGQPSVCWQLVRCCR